MPGPYAHLRVLTWNLWWRFGDWRRRAAAIEAVLTAEQPDVVCLQEVWTTEHTDHAALLAGRLGMQRVLVPSPAPGRWQQRLGDDTVGFANAILSRWPLSGRRSLVLPAPPGRPEAERTVLHATVQAPGGPVPVFTTQLESAPSESATRCAQVAAIARFVADCGRVGAPGAPDAPEHRREHRRGHPPVLTGDLNAEPDSDEIRLLGGHKTAPAVPGLVLLDAWRYAGTDEPGWTWDTRNPHVAATFEPSARIDYVMVGPPDPGGRGHVRTARVVGDRPVDGTWPSDHAGVLVELAP